MRARALQSLLLVLLVAGIGAANGRATDSRSSSVPKSFVGCWARHVPSLVGQPAGVWLVAIGANGAFAAYTPGSSRCGPQADFRSHVRVLAGRLTIGPVPICAGSGAYRATAGKASFTLRTVSDASCPSRAALLAGTWSRRH